MQCDQWPTTIVKVWAGLDQVQERFDQNLSNVEPCMAALASVSHLSLTALQQISTTS